MPKKNKKKKTATKVKAKKVSRNMTPTLKGKGFYSGFLSDLGGMVGSGLGALVGNPTMGGKIGSGLGGIASRITGFGDYKLQSNTIMADTGPPVFSNGADGSVSIARREYVGDVLSSIVFNNNVFQLNPSNPALFPWLSTISTAFEQYEFLGLVFEYRPTSGSAIASTNNALGVVIMSTSYDVLDAAFTSKQAMEAYQYTVSTVPANTAIHGVECKRSLNVLQNLYVRQFIQPSGADPRFYDLGKFQLATFGMQAANITIGELWVSYHIKLIKPKLPESKYMAFVDPTSTSTLNSCLANPTPSGWTGASVTQLVAPSYTTSAGRLDVAMNLPGNYLYYTNAYVGTGTTSSVHEPFTFNSTNSTNVTRIPCIPVGATTFTIEDYNQDYSATTAFHNNTGSSSSNQRVHSCGGVNVGIGGGIASFTADTSGLLSTGLVITYQGYQGGTILAGVDVGLDSKRPSNQLMELMQRLTKLETGVDCKTDLLYPECDGLNEELKSDSKTSLRKVSEEDTCSVVGCDLPLGHLEPCARSFRKFEIINSDEIPKTPVVKKK